MFIVGKRGRAELRQEFHVHAGHREHFPPDGARIAAAGLTIKITLLTVTEGRSTNWTLLGLALEREVPLLITPVFGWEAILCE